MARAAATADETLERALTAAAPVLVGRTAFAPFALPQPERAEIRDGG